MLLSVKELILIEMKQSLNEYITEMRYPTDLIILQTTDLFIFIFIFTCGDFFIITCSNKWVNYNFEGFVFYSFLSWVVWNKIVNLKAKQNPILK